MLTEYIIPMANRIRGRAVDIRKKEEAYCVEKRNNSENASDLEEELTEVTYEPSGCNLGGSPSLTIVILYIEIIYSVSLVSYCKLYASSVGFLSHN